MSNKKLRKKILDAASGTAAAAEAKAKLTVKVRDYESHVLVCTGGACKKRGAKSVRKTLKGQLRSEGLLGEVWIDTVDCLDLCEHGPNVVVYPEGTWYLGLEEADVPEVLEQHLKGGAPVERLTAERRSQKAKKREK